MKSAFRSLVVSAAVLVAGAAFAQKQGEISPGQEEAKAEAARSIPEEAKPAVEVLTRYLDAVKAKKWADAKKLTHPRTLQNIAKRKKNLGDEEHPMAPWYFAKDTYYLKDYRITNAVPGPDDTWVIETSEDNFQIQEKGVAEGEMATYLVGKAGGKWMVTDKKRGVSFTKDSIKLGYKGYFDQ
ncbi:MAG: hypothetical protein IRZ16_23960 [Myxococcaceae bacterium]|nr:hypothetical protein [Myxococcaceae bacterium]